MSGPDSKQFKILVVEDEFLVRLTLVEALSDEGFQVLEAETGDAALPILQSYQEISLLLTDIQLPGTINGHALAVKARENLPNLPIIFMTGGPNEETDGSARDVFISKPYTLANICGTAKRLTSAVVE
jgi:CheY-like chemotaxis protein